MRNYSSRNRILRAFSYAKMFTPQIIPPYKLLVGLNISNMWKSRHIVRLQRSYDGEKPKYVRGSALVALEVIARCRLGSSPGRRDYNGIETCLD
jgi:hypothetical protein